MSLLETRERRGDVANAIAYMDAMGDELALWYAENKPQTILDRGKSPDAIFDLSDPAKLAEMIAHEARRLNIPYTFEPRWFEPIAVVVRVDQFLWRPITMPQARALLAALLQLPDGAKEAAEKVLRGESNG